MIAMILNNKNKCFFNFDYFLYHQTPFSIHLIMIAPTSFIIKYN
jgi:hypothetical protein